MWPKSGGSMLLLRGGLKPNAELIRGEKMLNDDLMLVVRLDAKNPNDNRRWSNEKLEVVRSRPRGSSSLK